MLEANQLSKSYGHQSALSDLNLSIARGQIFCLLGQNGAGKTTTLHLFLGLIAPSSGEALIDGERVRPNRTPTNRKVAYIPELVRLYDHMSGLDNLDLFCRFARLKYTKTELKGILEQAGIVAADQHKKVLNYSKGMRQRVGIAIALSKNADFIFMDEPTSGLDPFAIAEFSKICRELKEQQKLIFMATHDVYHAAQLGTHFGIMKAGRLLQPPELSNPSPDELSQIYLNLVHS